MKRITIFDQPGVYEPIVWLWDEQVLFWRNDDGDPLVGVQINSFEHASKFSVAIRIQALEEKEIIR